ncbi:MAG: DUF1588 domain-containing protein [Planctomycetaceae bacterium]
MMSVRLTTQFIACTCMFLVIPVAKAAPFNERGAAVFAERCASCHGAKGEGTSDNPEALFGDKSTYDLADVIARTMPEGEPEVCVGDDAKAVAEWMQQAFYSPEAQARLHPPQRRLSRLTVSQYRNAIADLVESFTWSVEPGDERGLKARYYNSRNFRDKDKVIERLDPQIDFNFHDGTPDSEKIPEAEAFAIRWEGSVIIDQTGWYEFILKTENGGRLYVNDTRNALVDAWVKSGSETEYRDRRFLLAGRLYPVRLEWFTFKEKTASVGLWWKPPYGVDQPIPARHLTPQESPSVLVVETPFPPDDRSDGYIRGTSVSQEWDEATTFAAIETADRVLKMLPRMLKSKKDSSDDERREQWQEFCRTFAYRAFRRPLDEQQQQTYVDRHFQEAADHVDATKRSLLAILKSPRFLYREVTGEHDLFTQVERLSFALRDSIPDVRLLEAAQKQWISSEKSLRDQAWRLLNTYRGRVRLIDFLRVWMNVERLEDIAKDSSQYPDFTPELAADLRSSFELLLNDAVTTDDNGFQQLLTGTDTWMNDRMARFYGFDSVPDGGFSRMKLDPEHRAGVISHPFLLAGFAYQDSSSPIHRGVFLSRGVLGRALKPPPDSVAPLTPELEPDLTTRQRVTKQTSPQMCANCHVMINSLGFALEEFDAVGRFRRTEKDKPVDATGLYRLRDGELKTFRGAPELAAFLLNNSETHRSFVRQLFHHVVQQPILAYGPESLNDLVGFFADHDLNMKHLIIEIAVRSAVFSEDRSPQTAGGE